jgi:glucokinase-like ROK family protein
MLIFLIKYSLIHIIITRLLLWKDSGGKLEAFFNTLRIKNTKNINRRVVLDLIRFTPEGISRAEVARQMGLTRSGVWGIITELNTKSLIEEIKIGETSGGRRPILLSINQKIGFVVGIDMGATHLGIKVTDFSAQVLQEVEQPFSLEADPVSCIRQIDLCLKKILYQMQLELNQISAIGISVPGPVNYESGMVSSAPIMPGWDEFPIRSYLQQLWQVPVVVGNDAEMGALGEWSYGVGRGENYLAYVKVGTGVGAGFILDGQIYRGKKGSAGEIGHITIRENGPKCSCGNYGCLEAMAGGRAIARNAGESIKRGQRTLLSMLDPTKIMAINVAQAAQKGDLVAQQIIAEAGSYLGIAIASLVNLFNPGMIIIGGGVSQIGDLLLEPIRKTVMERSLSSAAKEVRITTAVLGRRATSMGAVVQAINLSLDRLVDV